MIIDKLMRYNNVICLLGLSKEANKTKIFLFFRGPFKNRAHAQGLCCYKHLNVEEGHPRGGGGGDNLIFSSYVGSGLDWQSSNSRFFF